MTPALAQPPEGGRAMMMMGGPGGGPPGGMMMMGGGPPGMSFGGEGFGRGGRGGRDGGGRDGGGGGFDPTAFLGRMDTNGNGSLDPDEMQGPARFFLDRMAQNNPKIDLTKPIPLSTITGEFEKMRSDRGGGGGGGGFGGGGWGGWGGDSDDFSAPETELVKGFGGKSAKEPPPGFGPKAETFSVKLEPRDVVEAEERIRRYDRNRDGMLDEEELKSFRSNDNPIQYDRNRDGKLSADELGVRYARKRISDAANGGQSNDGRGGGDDRRRGGGGGWSGGGGNWTAGAQGAIPGMEAGMAKQEEKKATWETSSFRATSASDKISKITGLPGRFKDADKNSDGQVTMNEFSSSWDDQVLEEFLKFDTNSDGIITAKECLAAVKKNILFSTTGSGGGSSTSSGGSSTASGTNKETTAGSLSREGLPEDADPKWVKWVEAKIVEKDRNKSGSLSPDEWSPSSGDFNKVDSNGDGQISLAEYYNFRQAGRKK